MLEAERGLDLRPVCMGMHACPLLINSHLSSMFLQVLDVSEAAGGLDLRPNRLECMLQAARDFVRNFFDQVRKLDGLCLSSGCTTRTSRKT